VSGGVNLSPPPPKISQDPSLDWIGPKNSVPAAIPTRPARTEFDVSGRRVQALSIPPLARISLGHFALGATDLSIPTGEGQALSLTRHYHSSLTSAGPLGRGWHLSLPQVRMERRGPHCTLYLTDTLQTYRQKLGVVDAGSLITSLNNGKVIDFRGDADTRWYFGPERRLTRCKVGNDEWTYDYDGVKLRRLSFTHQGQTVASIDLDYNADGLIAAARDNQGHTVRFRYDTQQRLVGVTGSAGSTEYSYTDDHRLASVHSPSGSRNFRYDAAGNLTADVDGAGQGLTYRRQPTGDGGIRVETIDPSGQGTDVFFDPFGIVSRLQRQGRVLDRTHEGAVEVLTLKTGDASLAQMRYDPSARTIDNLVPGESSEHVELDANGVPRRSTIESTVDGSRMAVEYGDDGKPVRMTDPAGGEYRLLEAGNRQQESVTPSGTYRITSDEQGRRIRLELPSGKVREWGYSDARATEPVAVAERGPQDVHQWQSRKPNHWELSANNEPVSMLSTDEHGRVLSLQAPSGATVKAQHGAGGSVVRLPDHRQVVIRRNASGQIVEVRELPRNSPPAAMPVEDLVGKSKAQQLVRPLGRLRKEK
jgi:YD repeat-containing protein